MRSKNPSRFYLIYLENNPVNNERVKNKLQSASDKRKIFDELETQLYERIQQDADKEFFNELLIWMYVQQKDFESAFLQAKALDKRNKEDGTRIIELARLAVNEEYFDDAILAYEYVIDKGENEYYYFIAKSEVLNTRKQKLSSRFDYTEEDVLSLKGDYLDFLDVYGFSINTATTIRELSHLEAFFLHNTDSAISLSERLIKMPNLQPKTLNETKLDLGDFYTLDGDVWEATLLYAQVDKSEKDSPLGEMARFKNAKLSYYKGEFEWAQAQLNVLKGSTSELIANDALQLSIFIMDNLGLDTTSVPMLMFARADLQIFQNDLDAAVSTLDSITYIFPGHALDDDILFAKAKINLKQRNFSDAKMNLQRIIDHHGDDLLGDDATFHLARLCEKQLELTETAMELYKSLIINYKDSVLVVDARKRFRFLRGDTFEDEDIFMDDLQLN